ncbi:hypothetical protein KR067_003631 [Drosophila pandora]|nr:hypothetical protein KR067_003631 [Drosophila pandora]
MSSILVFLVHFGIFLFFIGTIYFFKTERSKMEKVLVKEDPKLDVEAPIPDEAKVVETAEVKDEKAKVAQGELEESEEEEESDDESGQEDWHPEDEENNWLEYYSDSEDYSDTEEDYSDWGESDSETDSSDSEEKKPKDHKHVEHKAAKEHKHVEQKPKDEKVGDKKSKESLTPYQLKVKRIGLVVFMLNFQLRCMEILHGPRTRGDRYCYKRRMKLWRARRRARVEAIVAKQMKNGD